MIKGQLLFEDLQVDFVHSREGYEIQCFDRLTGKSEGLYCTLEEGGAIMHLLFGPPADLEQEEILYDKVEHLFEGFPLECRPIP